MRRILRMPHLPAMILAITLQALVQTRSAPWPANPPPSRTTHASSEQSKDPLQEAEELLQKQQYADAREKLQALTGTQAKNPQAWFDLGYAHSHLGEIAEAI